MQFVRGFIPVLGMNALNEATLTRWWAFLKWPRHHWLIVVSLWAVLLIARRLLMRLLHTAAAIFLIFWLVALRNQYWKAGRTAAKRSRNGRVPVRFQTFMKQSALVWMVFQSWIKYRKARNINTSPPAIKVYLLRWPRTGIFFPLPVRPLSTMTWPS